MKGDYIILSKSSSIDSNSNLISIFEIIDEITLSVENQEALRQVSIPLQAVINITREEEDGEGEIDATFQIAVINPEGERNVLDKRFNVHFTRNHRRFRIRVNLQLNFTSFGQYFFEVFDTDGNSYCSNDLIVKEPDN